MRFNLLQSLIAISLIPLAAALQTIYFGTIGSSAGPYNCIAFFSDSNPCTDGNATFGGPFCEDNYCKEGPITLLGHAGIQFTGCKPNPNMGGPVDVPKGVSDGGTPALKCAAASNPTGTPDGAFATCEPDEGNTNVGFVNLDSYCS